MSTPIASTLKSIFGIRRVRDRNAKDNQSKGPYTQTTSMQEKDTESRIYTDSFTKSKEGSSFQYSEGRRYQNEAEVSYLLPNDFDEIDRIHQQHWIFKYILKSNFASPLHEELTKGIQVLDSGCGPGTWTFDMAEKYPASKFYGVDCSSVFPENIKPANAEFAVSNIGKEIPFPDNTFDFMFQRLLFLGLSNDDWDKCLAEAYRIIKPGGYFELVEPDMDDLVNAGPLFTEQVNIVKQLMKLRNLVPSIASELKDRLEKAGFVVKSIKGTDFKMNHTDKSGKLYWDDFKQGNLGLTYIVSKVKPEFGNEEVFSNFLDQVGVETSEYKSATKFYVFCAQKPL